MKYLFLGVKVAGRNLSCAWLRPAEGVCVASLWAGDGVARGRAVPLEDEVERVPSVVWCAGVVCFVPVDVVRSFVDAAHGDGRVPVRHGEGGSYGEVVFDVVAVDGYLLAGFFVGEGGVLVGVEVVTGADPHFAYLCECGALGCGVGCFGECHALVVGGGAVDGAVLVDGDGRVFCVVGSAGDVGRVWFYVDAHEHGVVGVAVLLELNDACALEDAVDPHGCVEKNGGLHGVFSCVVFFLVSVFYRAWRSCVYMCRETVACVVSCMWARKTRYRQVERLVSLVFEVTEWGWVTVWS